VPRFRYTEDENRTYPGIADDAVSKGFTIDAATAPDWRWEDTGSKAKAAQDAPETPAVVTAPDVPDLTPAPVVAPEPIVPPSA